MDATEVDKDKRREVIKILILVFVGLMFSGCGMIQWLNKDNAFEHYRMKGNSEKLKSALNEYWIQYPSKRLNRSYLSMVENLWPRSTVMGYDETIDTTELFNNIKKYYYPRKISRITTNGKEYYALYWRSMSENGNYSYMYGVKDLCLGSALTFKYVSELENDTAFFFSWNTSSFKERKELKRMFKSDVVEPVHEILKELKDKRFKRSRNPNSKAY